jgi:hypothetical protein
MAAATSPVTADRRLMKLDIAFPYQEGKVYPCPHRGSASAERKEPEASVSNTNPNDPFTAEVANENRSPLRASRTTTFPRAGTNVVSTVMMLAKQ